MEAILERLRLGVINGKRKDVMAACEDGLKQGLAGSQMLNEGLLKGMETVGTRFRCGDYFIPEVLVAARSLQAGIEVLKPDLARNPPKMLGKVVLGTVSGDLHDIGKNLVSLMLAGAGFEVVDLGIDVAPEKFVAKAMEVQAEAVAVSALLTTTMVNMKAVVDALRQAGYAGKVIVGGAPVTQEFAAKIGADLYAADAAEGADKLRSAIRAA